MSPKHEWQNHFQRSCQYPIVHQGAYWSFHHGATGATLNQRQTQDGQNLLKTHRWIFLLKFSWQIYELINFCSIWQSVKLHRLLLRCGSEEIQDGGHTVGKQENGQHQLPAAQKLFSTQLGSFGVVQAAVFRVFSPSCLRVSKELNMGLASSSSSSTPATLPHRWSAASSEQDHLHLLN